MWGKDWTVDELMMRLLRDVPFFEQSGGGVTNSGGEALSQFEFTLKCSKA
jgi:pyruvate formate lyase activating enzyme